MYLQELLFEFRSAGLFLPDRVLEFWIKNLPDFAAEKFDSELHSLWKEILEMNESPSGNSLVVFPASRISSYQKFSDWRIVNRDAAFKFCLSDIPEIKKNEYFILKPPPKEDLLNVKKARVQLDNELVEMGFDFLGRGDKGEAAIWGCNLSRGRLQVCDFNEGATLKLKTHLGIYWERNEFRIKIPIEMIVPGFEFYSFLNRPADVALAAFAHKVFISYIRKKLGK